MISSLSEFSLVHRVSFRLIELHILFFIYFFLRKRINSKSIYCQFNCIIWFNGNWVKKKVNDSALFHYSWDYFFFLCISLRIKCYHIFYKCQFVTNYTEKWSFYCYMINIRNDFQESIYTYDLYHGMVWKTKQRKKEKKREIQFRASREKNDKICYENSSLLSISWVAYLMISKNAALSFESV